MLLQSVCRFWEDVARSAGGISGWSGDWGGRYFALRPFKGDCPPHAASRDCRNGSPLARANPCSPAVFQRFLHALPLKPGGRAPPTASRSCRPAARFHRRTWERLHPETKTGKKAAKGKPAFFVSDPRSAASRARMAGWAGEVGADLASARGMRPPPSPARTSARHGSPPSAGKRQHDSARLATTHASPTKAARRLATTTASRETTRHHTGRGKQHPLSSAVHWLH